MEVQFSQIFRNDVVDKTFQGETIEHVQCSRGSSVHRKVAMIFPVQI